ncbi:HEAT repeat domain-containing protein, partial [Acidobacteriota bacterium]
EFSLAFRTETLYEDAEKKKSLPFLLYKDGMRELSFYEGMDLEEIGEFLETLKENADLPEEESDIINSLWQKDFGHIHYFALDEYQDKNIGDNNSGSELIPEKDKLSTGKIELTQEDKDDIDKHIEILSVEPGCDFTGGPNTTLSNEDRIKEAATITKSDFPEIDRLVKDDRESSRIRVLITVLFEVLFLEDRKDQFADTLNVLESHHQDTLKKADFSQASLILNQIFDLNDVVPKQDKDKLQLLDRFIMKAKDKSALQKLEKIFINERIKNLDLFLEYLFLLCPESIPTTIEIWEKAKDLNIKNKISGLFQKISDKHIDTLVEFARNGHASLAREIINILGKGDKINSIPHLKIFAAHKEKSIRLGIIHAVQNICDSGGDEILFDMLSDKEEQIRIGAVTRLNHLRNPAVTARIIDIIRKKDFNKKSRSEKRALLNYCAQNGNDEITLLFHSILSKKDIFVSKKSLQTRFCVISALEKMATPEALIILKEGSHSRIKRIRKTCKSALRKLAARNSLYRDSGEI